MHRFQPLLLFLALLLTAVVPAHAMHGYDSNKHRTSEAQIQSATSHPKAYSRDAQTPLKPASQLPNFPWNHVYDSRKHSTFHKNNTTQTPARASLTWPSRNPAGFVDGPNLYAYVKQNPWSAFDPLGLAEEKAERLPSRNYGFFEGEPGNSRFIIDQKTQPDLAKKYPNGVDFKKGRPDFSPMKPGSISAKGVKLQTEYEIKLTGDTGADTAQARSQMIKQVREELKVSYKEADKIVRESLKDFRLHHHLDTNKIIVVPQDVHAMGHYGERAASAARMGKVKGGIGKALAGIAILQWLDPGQALAGPLGATTMGDATVSGAIERGLPQNDVSPGERLQFLQFARGYLGGDKAASDSFSLWNSAGYEQELQHRESLQPK